MLAVFIHLDDTAPGGFFQIHLAYHQVFCVLNLIIVLAHPASQSASEWTCVLHSNFHSLLVIISLRRFCRSHCKILDINWIWYWQGRCTCTWEDGEVFWGEIQWLGEWQCYKTKHCVGWWRVLARSTNFVHHCPPSPKVHLLSHLQWITILMAGVAIYYYNVIQIKLSSNNSWVFCITLEKFCKWWRGPTSWLHISFERTFVPFWCMVLSVLSENRIRVDKAENWQNIKYQRTEGWGFSLAATWKAPKGTLEAQRGSTIVTRLALSLIWRK